MTDLLDVIPEFPSERFLHIVNGLEEHLITTSDLLTLDAVEIARRARLPVLDLKHFVREVLSHIYKGHGFCNDSEISKGIETAKQSTFEHGNAINPADSDYAIAKPLISTLDDALDGALNGGIASGYVTEVTGESGAGKTQFLLTLLLSAQLPAPQGLARGTIYISTEHALPTQRLESILKSNSKLKDHPSPPSLKHVLSIQIPDLETQDHILTYQLPVAVKSKKIGLVIIDSIAANYRAEAETGKSNDAGKSQAKALAARSVDLVKTGALLREIAQKNNCAIVVANQVSDRFEQRSAYGLAENAQKLALIKGSQQGSQIPNEQTSALTVPRASGAAPPHSSPLFISQPSSSPSPMPPWSASSYTRPPSPSLLDPRLTLDHQMRFFSGWGDKDSHQQEHLKTPTLGLTWTNQIACRIVIIRESSVVGQQMSLDSGNVKAGDRTLQSLPESGIGGADWSQRRWRRWMRVVFAAWAQEVEEGDKGIEFEVWDGGLRAVTRP